MPDFSAHVIGTEHEASIDDETGADPRADVNGEHTRELATGSEVVFAPRNRVEIVRYLNPRMRQ